MNETTMNTNENINTGKIILYQPDNAIRLEVRVEDETVWLSQAQIAELFGTKRPAITKHLSNIFSSGELLESSVCSILELTASDGKNYQTKLYNLDAILSVGYRVNSINATQFRRWANRILKEYLLRGYAINRHIEQVEKFMIDTGQRITKTEVKFDLLTQYIEDVLSDYNNINQDTRMQLELIHEALAELQVKNKESDTPRRLIGFRRGADEKP